MSPREAAGRPDVGGGDGPQLPDRHGPAKYRAAFHKSDSFEFLSPRRVLCEGESMVLIPTNILFDLNTKNDTLQLINHVGVPERRAEFNNNQVNGKCISGREY